MLLLSCSQKLKGSSSTSRDCMRQTQEDFQEAVNRRDKAEISRLLKNGFNINALNEAGDTPLHQCIRDGKTESAKLLVEFGADVKRTNRDGWSPRNVIGPQRSSALFDNAFQRQIIPPEQANSEQMLTSVIVHVLLWSLAPRWYATDTAIKL